ncbi:MAG TPA: histidine kinase [Bryobacteraceae bacterium]|jgi:signal transduction histidine kinase
MNWRRLYTRTGLLELFAVFTAVGFLQFWYRYLDHVARGTSVHWQVPFIEQMTGNYVSLLMLIVYITPIVLRYRPDLKPNDWGWLPVHLIALFVYSLIHTSLLWGSRSVLFVILGMGPYDYGIIPVRYSMEFPTDVIDYIIQAGALIVFLRLQEARANEVRLAEVKGDLVRAKLESLSLQLQPHFLFNSLNAVAALIYDNPHRADLMLSRLAGYLRRTLQSGPEQAVPLERELETLDLYITMMKARFEENLTMDVRVEDRVKRALAPQLILQPIVENAIQHGFDPASGRVCVELTASKVDDVLVLTVRDHGRGLDPGAAPRIGLANTRNRLEHLYGARSTFRISNADGGGAEVEIRIPFELAPAAVAAA